MDAGIESLLGMLPKRHAPFEGSEYPMPVSQAVLGEMPDVARLREWLKDSSRGELKDALEAVAVAAEVVESAQADRGQYFMDDGRVRSYVFRGAKWRAGWILLAGTGVADSLVGRLKAAEYMVFSSRHAEMRDQPMPERPCGAVYFLQMALRYAMIWGRIPPGEHHDMGHFLERDMPGAAVVLGEVSAVEGLVLLALMKLGVPAVVGPEFPHEMGPRAVARSEDEVIEALASFPNMRVRVVGGEEIRLPDGADPANLREEVKPARTVRGLFQLRPAPCEGGVEVSGDQSSDKVAVIVEVDDPKLDLPISAHLEAQGVQYGSYLKGVKTRRTDGGGFAIELAEGVRLEARLLGEVIRAGLKRTFPKLGSVRVRLAFGGEAAARERARAGEFERERDAAILAESEATAEEFHLCIDCQPFSHSHVCVVTPDRPPMCGRSRGEIKSGALWGTDYRPWTRREVGDSDLQRAVRPGEAIDEAAGEWRGINAAAGELTGGRLQRVRIHAVCDSPHTSCGCFGALAFSIPGTGWIGVMDRSYKGVAPGELTWGILANRAGGKQHPGVTGIALKYLESPKALAGEGGLAAVKWATRKALDIIMKRGLPPGARVATESEATTIKEFRSFLRKK